MKLKQLQRQRLKLEEFPRSAEYDPQWMIDNKMGPNVLWLTEALSEKMDLQPGMRVLDLGCGRAISSIFLAKEFDVEVWATDLWIQASDNLSRIREAGMTGQVVPIHAEAHELPFAESFFDAVVSMDAYHYFGTDDLYLGYHLIKFLKRGGAIGIVVPGIREEFEAVPPDHVKACWEWDFCSFHSPQWWRTHWEKTGLASIEIADLIPNGWRHWLIWDEVNQNGPDDDRWLHMLRTDAGQNIGFTRVVARKNPDEIPQPYFPFAREES